MTHRLFLLLTPIQILLPERTIERCLWIIFTPTPTKTTRSLTIAHHELSSDIHSTTVCPERVTEVLVVVLAFRAVGAHFVLSWCLFIPTAAESSLGAFRRRGSFAEGTGFGAESEHSRVS